MKNPFIYQLTLLSLALTGFSILSTHATSITANGSISSNTIWSADTVLVNSNVTVNDGVTLTINPGVTVIFTGSYAINVQGRLLAQGSEADSIRFTPGDTLTGWGGICFDNTPATNDSSILEYCVLEYAIKGGTLSNGGGLVFNNVSKALILNSSIRNCSAEYGGGIGILDYSNPVITNTTLRGNNALYGGGMCVSGYCNPVITTCILVENTATYYGGGMCVFTYCDPVITTCILSENNAIYGGGMYLEYLSDPVLSQNNLIGNNAVQGGGIYMYHSNPVITNSTLSGNTANVGGGMSVENSNPVLTNTTLSGNTAQGGGGIYVYYSNPVITNCILWGNAASIMNGIYNYGMSAPDITYSNIQDGFTGTGNISLDPLFMDAPNGDFRLQPSSPCINAGTPDTTGLSLPDTDVEGNPRIYSCAIDMGAYESNDPLVVGGLITMDTDWASDTVYVRCDVDIANGATLTINPGVTVFFKGNYAINVQGRLLALGAPGDSIRFTPADTAIGWGGIQFSSTPHSNDSSILDHCVIAFGRKSSFGTGGGLCIESFSKLRLSHSIIRNCRAFLGGAIYMSFGSSPKILQSKLLSNSASNSGGGMFMAMNSNAIVSECIISGNVSQVGGGILMHQCSPVIQQSIIDRNRGSSSAGGIYINTNSNPVLSNSTLFGNSAGQTGGGILVGYESDPVLTNCILWGNTAPANGGLFADASSNPQITYSNIQGGHVGIGNINVDPFFADQSSANFRLLPTSPCINAGTPDTTGLGLTATDLDGNPRVLGCRVDMGAYENTRSVGGNISANTIWDADTFYVNCDVNVANGVTLTINPGATVIFTGSYGIYVQGRLLAQGTAADSIRFTVADTTGFAANTHTGWKGIRFNETPATNDSSLLSYCILEYGKNVSITSDGYGGCLYVLEFSKLRLSNSLIQYNNASLGGAICIDRYCDPVLINNTIQRNSAAGHGGGINIRIRCNPTIASNTIKENTAASHGGGIYMLADCNPKLLNNTVLLNTAAYGGGITIFGCYPALFNNTFQGNIAHVRGGGLLIGSCDPIVNNCILWDNTAPTDPGIYLSTANPVITYSNIQGGYAGTGNIDMDPLFVDAVTGDVRLLPCSPMINAGTPDTTGMGLPSLDYYGQIRVQHGRVDIGAAEYNGSTPQSLSLNSSKTVFCEGEAGVKLNGTPAGGTYSGHGVAGGNFYPVFAGVGQHWVFYQVKDSVACPTRDSLLMTVHPLPALSHPDIQACADETLLQLSGGSPATGTYSGAHISGGQFNVQSAGVGTHIVNYTYQDGITLCTRIITFQVTVHPLPEVVFNIPQPICQGNGMISLQATPAGGSFSGPFVSGNSFDATQANVGNHLLTYTFTDQNGCAASDKAVFEVLPLPQVQLNADTTICQGSCVSLQAGGGSTYLWNTGSTSPGITVCPSQTMNFTVTVTATNGCTATGMVQIATYPLPLADAGADQQICQGQQATLTAANAGAGAQYHWGPGLQGMQVFVNPATTTTYVLTVTSQQGCTATDAVTVTVRPLPQASVSGIGPLCPGDCGILQASGGTSYQWQGGGNQAQLMVCPTVTTTYQVTVTNAFLCTAQTSVQVNVHPAVVADAGADQWICPGTCAHLQATGGVQYAWSGGAQQAATQVCPVVETWYHVTVTSSQGCQGVDSVRVSVHSPANYQIIGNDTIQPGGTATLMANISSGQPPYTYHWSPEGTLLGNGSASIQVQPPASLLYQLHLLDGNGCTSTEDFLVTVQHPGASAVGKIVYANAQQTPVGGATVFLLDAAKTGILDSTLTDVSGYFYFNDLDTTAYTILPALEGRWGWAGANSTDALLVAKHFVQLDTLTGIYLKAGDVDASLSLNTTDALMIGQRFSGHISGFASGDWCFSPTLIQASGDDPDREWTLMEVLNYGDVNGSGHPTQKAGPRINLERQGMIAADQVTATGLPLILEEAMEVGAISLVLRTPLAKAVRDVHLPAGAGGYLGWTARGDELRLSWFANTPLQISEGQAMLYLVLDAKALPGLEEAPVVVVDHSELSDAHANPYLQTRLLMPGILPVVQGTTLNLWPNPATESLNVSLQLGEAGKVEMQLLDLTGRLINLVHQGSLEPGHYNWQIDTRSLPSGSYLLSWKSQMQQGVEKLIITH